MKFDLLLAQYLYKHKKLNLPGIGTFEADNTVYVNDENEKQKPSLSGVTFRDTAISKADDDLIEFIKVQTGKMKPLAISDLESYLTLGKQFLYIGKPFYMEGIGTLQLTKSGHFEFIPGDFITTKLDDPNIERSESKKRSVHEEDRMQQESNNNTLKKIFLALGILATLALVGWGGYYLYNINMLVDNQTSSTTDSTGLLQDSNLSTPEEEGLQLPAAPNDASLQDALASTNVPETKVYKFVVISTDNRLRAVNSLKLYKSYGRNMQIDSSDRKNYKLYFSIPALPGDTLRIRDSLNRWYYTNTSTIRVKIEE